MKLSKKHIKQIIREEKTKLLNERRGGIGIGFAGFESNRNVDFAKAYGKDARVLHDFGSNSARQNRLKQERNQVRQPARVDKMKVSKSLLIKIIKEEYAKILIEQGLHDLPDVQIVDWENQYDQTAYTYTVDGVEGEVWTSGTADVEWLIDDLTDNILEGLYPDIMDYEREIPQEWSEMHLHVSESVKSNSELMRAIPELEQAISDYASGPQGRTPRLGY